MNKVDIKRFAPLGLVLSALALVVAFVVYVLTAQINVYVQVALGVIVLGLALFVLLDPQRVRTLLTGRQARYGSNALLMGIAFVGILIVVNYIIYQNPQRWDLTNDKTHTLDKQTTDTLAALPQPVFATAYFTTNTSSETARTMLDNFKSYSKGKFSYKFVDPNADPVAARAANVTTDGTILLQMGDRQEKITSPSPSESDVTGALVKLMATKQTVYFLTGQDEANPEGTDEQSLSQVKKALEGKSYTVKTLNLLTTRAIPDDARLIVIAGPMKPVSDEEIKLIKSWQETKGGSLMVLEEPTLMTNYGTQADPLAAYLAQEWGLSLDNDIVIDTTSQSAYQAVAASYGNSPITSKLQGLYTVFPTARTITINSLQNVTAVKLVLTSQQSSWGETDLQGVKDQKTQPTFDSSKDVAGPLTLAASAERTGSKARVVVFGDMHFALDLNYQFYGNGDIFINSVDWLTEQENLINLTPKEAVTRLMISPTRLTQGALVLISLVLLPGLVILTGIVVFIQRRRRG